MKISIAIQPVERTGGQSRHEAEEAAVAAAIARLYPDATPVVGHHPDGAPFLPGRPREYISISHSATHAAVAVSNAPIGIDIEQPRPQLERVAARFLSEREQAAAQSIGNGLLKAWTAKEAVFKAVPEQGVDFARDIVLSDDFTTACFRGHLTLYFHVIGSLPESNLLTVATTSPATEITIT